MYKRQCQNSATQRIRKPSFSGKSSEAQHFHLAGVELVACSGDHQPILGQRALDHFGTFHQLFDGACDVHALEILRRFQFRFVRLPNRKTDRAHHDRIRIADAFVDVGNAVGGQDVYKRQELPYQVNPDRLVVSIREAVRDGKIQGIADMRDETSGRTGQRLVLVLKRDAVPKVVLNNLYKHSQLQQTFGANMLALVDGVPRTLSLDAFIRHWVNHQLEVIARRTAYLKREAEERDHILQGYLKALDMIDEVIALIRASESAETARTGLMDLLDVDEVQADAILAMQLRRLAALERQKILDEHNELMRKIADYNDILAKPERQRKIVGDELDEIVAKYGDERRTKILPYSGEMNVEDLIAEENVVVTVTHSGFIKRTKACLLYTSRCV